MQHREPWPWFLVLSFVGVLAFAGCTGNADEERAGPAPSGDRAPLGALRSLVDPALLRRWILVSIETEGSSRVAVPYGLYGITFSAERVGEEFRPVLETRGITREGLQAGVCDGCNGHGGWYEVGAEGSLALILLAQTLIACLPSPPLERLLPALLEIAVSYQVQGDILRIQTIDRRSGVSSVLTFSDMPPAATAVRGLCL